MNRLLDRLLRAMIKRGSLKVTWADGTVSVYGDGSGELAQLAFFDKSAPRDVLLNPELAIGEAYMERRLDFPDASLVPFLKVINDNWGARRPAPWMEALARLRYRAQRLWIDNSLRRARQNVAHHYDLDERLYRLFLDGDMQYSCAYFDRPGIDIDEAQWAKKRHVASKLALQPGHEVLDIGSGWGGLGLYIAEASGAHVTGVTLSSEQHRVSNERARQRGLDGQARFQLQDYRSLDRSFDRIVSVGMFEHVGVARYREFFETAERLLKPDGVMLLHSIGRFGPPGGTNPWLRKYIFPGGYIPALSEVLQVVERTELYVTDVEILRLHYAETLKAWRERFMARWEEAAAIYDERFCRMWEFYLAGAEYAFRSGGMMVFQLQLTKSQEALPRTRNYMFAAEAALSGFRDEGESMRLAGE